VTCWNGPPAGARAEPVTCWNGPLQGPTASGASGGGQRGPSSIPGVITAIVMIDAATDAIPEVAEAVADLEGVSEVYSTAGEVDLIAVVRVREFDQVAEVIAGRINKVPGVLETETHIAFRAYSRHDLEAAFSIGLESAD
jgi:DNA-binding Lrp family transcriptional regulator